mgnify:CR=1 FL=1
MKDVRLETGFPGSPKTSLSPFLPKVQGLPGFTFDSLFQPGAHRGWIERRNPSEGGSSEGGSSEVPSSESAL